MKTNAKKAANKSGKLSSAIKAVLQVAPSPEAIARVTDSIATWDKAAVQKDGAEVDILRTIATTGVEVTDAMLIEFAPHLAESSRGVKRSYYNRAFKLRAIMGAESVVALIDKAAELGGKRFVHAIDALKAAIDKAGAITGGNVATVAQRATLTNAGITAAKAAGAKAKASRKANESKPRTGDSAKSPPTPGDKAVPDPVVTSITSPRQVADAQHGALVAMQAALVRADFGAARKALKGKAVKLYGDLSETLALLAK